jgi:ketosteroid isomerase-like protein
MSSVVSAWSSGDIETVLAAMHPDIKCFPADVPEGRPFRGRDAFASYASDWFDAWDDHALVDTELLESGDYVVVTGRIRARGRGSQIEVTQDETWLFRLDGDVITEYHECGTKEAALELTRSRQLGAES